jgi:hypothetical protein
MVVADGVEYVANTVGEMSYWDSSTKAFISFGTEPPPGCGPVGIIALVGAIKDMGALSLLNLTDNNIGERVQKMKEMCVSRSISLLIN